MAQARIQPRRARHTGSSQYSLRAGHPANLTAEQATQVKHIQDAKFEALAKLENLKATDLKKYIAKRLSTFETADNDLMVLLDERQITIFKQQQVEKSNKYDAIVGGMKKQGISEAEINKKLAETEF